MQAMLHSPMSTRAAPEPPCSTRGRRPRCRRSCEGLLEKIEPQATFGVHQRAGPGGRKRSHRVDINGTHGTLLCVATPDVETKVALLMRLAVDAEKEPNPCCAVPREGGKMRRTWAAARSRHGR